MEFSRFIELVALSHRKSPAAIHEI
jgi:hypothetical protein